MELEYSGWGLANRFGNKIVLNKNLKKYPKLHNTILQHELDHKNKGIKHNLSHDFDSLGEMWLEKTIFMIKHPKSFVQLSPIYFYKKRPYFDLSLIIVYIIAITFTILWRTI